MTHDKVTVVALILTASSATAIGAPPTAQPPAASPGDTTDPSIPQCPEAIRNVDLSVEKLEGGVTLQFRAKKKDQVGELRLMLRELATLVEHHSKLAALHPELVDNSQQMLVMPAVDIDVRDIASGAQIQIRPENPGEVGVIRAEADQLKQLWDDNDCVKGDSKPERTVRT